MIEDEVDFRLLESALARQGATTVREVLSLLVFVDMLDVVDALEALEEM